MMKIEFSKMVVLAVALSSAAMTGSASATLLGDDIRGYFGGNLAVPGDPDNRFASDNAIVVDPGVEFTGTTGQDDLVSADFDGDSVLITFEHLGNHGPGIGHVYGGFAMAFADLGWVGLTGRIVGLAPDSGNTLPISSFSFTDDTLDIEFVNLSFPPGPSTLTARFDILTEHNGIPSGIPEPTTAALGLLAVAGLLRSDRRSRRRMI